MKELFTVLLSLITYCSFAQVGSPVTIYGTGWSAIHPMAAWLQLPDGYNPANKYPLLVVVHGVGEGPGSGYNVGTYESGGYLSKIYNNDQYPAYYRERGWNGRAWNPATGDSMSFIIISPQTENANGWFESNRLGNPIQYVYDNYSIDTNRVYITGLSGGGRATFRYSRGTTGSLNPVSNRPYTPAAIIPMSIADNVAENDEVNKIVSDSIPTWGFGSLTDTYGVVTDSLVEKMNRIKPGIARWTSYAGGHCCWSQFYTPTYTETVDGTNMNIYSWLLQYSRGDLGGGTPPEVTDPPTLTVTANATITLPQDSIQLTATPSWASGHGGTILWTKSTGGFANILTPTVNTTWIKGMTQGTYVFKAEVTQDDGQKANKMVTITVNPVPGGGGEPTPGGCKVLFDPSGPDSSTNWSTAQGANINPGDTLCMGVGNYNHFRLRNLRGTKENPIVIINYGGVATIYSDFYYHFVLDSCENVKVTGSGDPNEFYGIKSPGWAFSHKTTKIEVERVEGGLGYPGFGLQVKTDPVDYDSTTWYPYFEITDVNIHDTYMHHTNAEGYYIGYTNVKRSVKKRKLDGSDTTILVDAPFINRCLFYNNIATDNGWDGIQFSSVKNAEVFNNRVFNYGVHEQGTQNYGMIIGGRTYGRFYSNYIESGSGTGLQYFGGIEHSVIYNNVIVNAGADGFNTADRPQGSESDLQYTPQTFSFINNTIVFPAKNPVYMLNANGSVGDSNHIYNNIFVKVTAKPINDNNPMKGKYDTSHNMLFSTTEAAGFVNPSAGDFHLKPNSPAIDMGMNVSSFGITQDFEGTTRPYGGGFDIGAYEYSDSPGGGVTPPDGSGEGPEEPEEPPVAPPGKAIRNYIQLKKQL